MKWTRKLTATKFGLKKLETPFYHAVQNVFRYPEPCRRRSRVWLTDRRTARPPGIPVLKLKNFSRSAKNSRKFPLSIKLSQSLQYQHASYGLHFLCSLYGTWRTVRLISIQSIANANCEVISWAPAGMGKGEGHLPPGNVEKCFCCKCCLNPP